MGQVSTLDFNDIVGGRVADQHKTGSSEYFKGDNDMILL